MSKDRLVGSGSFKVDRRRALEKLTEFQLPDPDMFLLPWIRCAVASGATRLTLDLVEKEIRFNGRGFTQEELADPCGCLFDEAASAPPRNRHLSYALLATLRRLERPFSLISGRRPNRLLFTVESERGFYQTGAGLKLRVRQLPKDSGSDTIVNLGLEASGLLNPLSYNDGEQGEVETWSYNKVEQTELAVLTAAAADRPINPLTYSESVNRDIIGVSNSVGCAFDHHISQLISLQVLPARVAKFIRERSEKQRPRLPETDHTLEFGKGSLAGWLHVPGRLNPDGSRLRLAHFGAVVESMEERSVAAGVPVEGTINNNNFQLNLSQSGVVRDERYNAVIQKTAAQAEELLSKVCRGQAARMQAAGQVHKSLLLQRVWARWLKLGEEAEAGGFRSLDLSEQIRYVWKYVSSTDRPDPEWAAAGNRRLIWSTARATAWLRHLCALAGEGRLAVAEKTLTDLKTAPIFWGVKETLLSMADLEKTLFRLGYVPVSTQKVDRRPPLYPVAWAWCAEERAALDQIFPGKVAEEDSRADRSLWLYERVTASAGEPPLPEKPAVPVPEPTAAETQKTESRQAEASPPLPEATPFEPAAQEPAPSRRTGVRDSLATQLSGDPTVLQLAQQILSHLGGRRGMKVLGQSVPTLHLQRLSGGGLLNICREDCWDLNYAHPLMKAMLDSSLSDSEKAVYLASLVYTAANRDLASVTDQDDVKFQQALADHLTEGFKVGA